MINKNLHFAGDDRMTNEFKYIEKYVGEGLRGIDIGCGTNRLGMEVLAIDANPLRKYAHADIVHDCKDIEINKEVRFNGLTYTFKNNELDFIFSSHCLEDFDDIPSVFRNWWRKLKVGGLMILFLPDMEPCDCKLCQSPEQKELRKAQGMSARYWTLEDYKNTGKGNPSHRTNVGKQFMTDMLQMFAEKNQIKYEILQMDTIPHNESCSIDFVIKKL